MRLWSEARAGGAGLCAHATSPQGKRLWGRAASTGALLRHRAATSGARLFAHAASKGARLWAKARVESVRIRARGARVRRLARAKLEPLLRAAAWAWPLALLVGSGAGGLAWHLSESRAPAAASTEAPLVQTRSAPLAAPPSTHPPELPQIMPTAESAGAAVADAASGLDQAPGARLRRADLAGQRAPRSVKALADWALDSGDAGGLPFAVIDKRVAGLFVFDQNGRMLGSTPVLLGLAFGDDSVAGIGERELADVLPHERTTPAGRFVVEPGRNTQGEDVIWVDYEAAVSMHRVRASKPAEHRMERLASRSPADNRISYGCINVPVVFYDAVVKRMFSRAGGIVYVLPETRPVQAVFASYDVEARQREASVAVMRQHTAER